MTTTEQVSVSATPEGSEGASGGRGAKMLRGLSYVLLVLYLAIPVAKLQSQGVAGDSKTALQSRKLAGLSAVRAGRHEEAENIFKALLADLHGYESTDPEFYRAETASTLWELGRLYNATQRIEAAIEVQLELVKIEEEEARLNPSISTRMQLEVALSGLGSLYRTLGRAEDAVRVLEQIVMLLRATLAAAPEGADKTPIQVVMELPVDTARALTSLGTLYRQTNRLGEAERVYQEAVEILREHASQYRSQRSQQQLAMTLNNFANLYSETNRYIQSETLYLEALQVRREVAQRSPLDGTPGLALTLENLAGLYGRTARTEEALSLLEEALPIRRQLAGSPPPASSPESYKAQLANLLAALAEIYGDRNENHKATLFLEEALPVFRKLAGEDASQFQPDLERILILLSALYGEAKRFDESNALLDEAIALVLGLWGANPDAHGDSLARVLISAAGVRMNTHSGEFCPLAQEALSVARAPNLKQRAQEILTRCAEPSTSPSGTP
ncbi:MAG: tetratricopeptide repeat protein [Acidobacteria bacterium]|nr:tetratricopeptide repeat protein [Acidobacteriota bacterium]